MRIARILVLVSVSGAPVAALAGDLPMPTEPVILVVTGDIENANRNGEAHFDLPMLDALAARETIIETPWYDGVKVFEGPLVSAVMDAVGADGDTLRVKALNDYSAEIPQSDIDNYPVILATRIDGETISVREKGPVFVIYPFDAVPSLYNEMIFGRSVWQVSSIDVF